MRYRFALSIVGLIMVLVIIFIQPISSISKNLIYHPGGDLDIQFISWWQLGSQQLAQGIIPLWNPHILSGTPFLGSFQTALCYPFTWLFIWIPLIEALNLCIIFHVFLSALGFYLWASRKQINPLASFLGAVTFCTSGAYFLHIFPGHMTILTTASWIPFIFIAFDHIIEEKYRSGLILGSLFVSIQIFAGHPQYVYYTGITGIIYFLLSGKYHSFFKKMITLAAMYVWGGTLSAIQIIPAFQATTESVRNSEIPYEFISQYHLLPDSFLTIFSPLFWGDFKHSIYWGRYYFWEINLFFGVIGFWLAIYALIYSKQKMKWTSGLMIFITVLMGFGKLLPIYNLLYRYLPGYALFRGICKINIITALFCSLLMSIGCHELFANKLQRTNILKFAVAGSACLFAGFASILHFTPVSTWQKIVEYYHQTGQTALQSNVLKDLRFLEQSSNWAIIALSVVAVTHIMFFLVLFIKRYRMACGAMVILVLTEMLGYAYYSTPLNPPDFKYLKTIRTLTSSSDSFNRIAWIGQHNKTSLTGGYDIAGYDSAAPRRYSEFLVIAQGESPDMVRQAIQIKRYHPLYEMLQCRYWISKQGDQLKVEEFPCRIPYSYFVRNYKVFSHRHDVFYEMIRSPFQAPKEVFLETLPVFGPVHKNSKTSVEFERISVNEIELKVKSKVPGILVISESYSKYWHAISLINPVKHAYSVEPANGAFCSIPLTAGDHHIAMTYLPSGFISGGYISMLAWTLFLMIIIGRKKHSKKL